MTNATPSDYQSMVGAAIAVQNMKQAEAWLRDALGKFPKRSEGAGDGGRSLNKRAGIAPGRRITGELR